MSKARVLGKGGMMGVDVGVELGSSVVSVSNNEALTIGYFSGKFSRIIRRMPLSICPSWW